MKHRLLALLVAGWVLFVASRACADVLTKPEEIVAAVKAGREGAWLDKPALLKCLQADQRAEALQQEVNMLVVLKESYERTIATLQDQVRVFGEASRVWELKAQAEHGLVLALEADLSAWYRNPFITLPGGLLVGGVAGIVLTGRL